MIIDIEPNNVIPPNTIDTISMEMRGINELYCFYQNGKIVSTKWSVDELKTFVPSMTVSEYMDAHILNGIRTFVNYHPYIINGFHPLWDDSKYHHKTGNPDFGEKKCNPTPLGYKRSREYQSGMFLFWEAYYKSIHPLIFTKIVK